MSRSVSRPSDWVVWQKVITDDLIRLHSHRQIYNEYVRIIQQNKSVMNDGVIFHNWVVDNYVTFVAMTIRRQADNNAKYSDVISLAKLISDITKHPKDLTRSWYVGLWTKGVPDSFQEGQANQTFTSNAGSGEYFDSAIGFSDLARLTAASSKIKRLATLSIAHNTKKLLPKVTFDEVNACIDMFRELVQKYILLLTASSNAIEPVIDDWQNIFTKKWVQ